MQCPKCGYEPTLAETQRSPDDCVKCGINYAGHARHLAEQAQRKKESAAIIKLAPAVRDAAAKYPGAQPVVVIDINMGFWSMVMFMVKFVFATIPAAIIVTVLVTVAVSAFSAFQTYTTPSPSPVASSERAPALPINVPLPVNARYFEIDRSVEGTWATLTVRTEADNGGVSYSILEVDCERGVARITARGQSLAELLQPQTADAYGSVEAGTPRKYVAAHACRGQSAVAPVLQ